MGTITETALVRPVSFLSIPTRLQVTSSETMMEVDLKIPNSSTRGSRQPGFSIQSAISAPSNQPCHAFTEVTVVAEIDGLRYSLCLARCAAVVAGLWLYQLYFSLPLYSVQDSLPYFPYHSPVGNSSHPPSRINRLMLSTSAGFPLSAHDTP